MFVGIHVPGEKPHGGSGSKGNHHHKSNRPHHRRRHHHLKSPSEAHRPGEFVNAEDLFFRQVSLYQRGGFFHNLLLFLVFELLPFCKLLEFLKIRYSLY